MDETPNTPVYEVKLIKFVYIDETHCDIKLFYFRTDVKKTKWIKEAVTVSNFWSFLRHKNYNNEIVSRLFPLFPMN